MIPHFYQDLISIMMHPGCVCSPVTCWSLLLFWSLASLMNRHTYKVCVCVLSDDIGCRRRRVRKWNGWVVLISSWLWWSRLRADTGTVTPSGSLWPFTDKWALLWSYNLSFSLFLCGGTGSSHNRRGKMFSFYPWLAPAATQWRPVARRHVLSSEPRTSGKPSAGSHWLRFRCGRQELRPLNLWSDFETYPFQNLLLGSLPIWIQARNRRNVQSSLWGQTGGISFMYLCIFAQVSHVQWKQQQQITTVSIYSWVSIAFH